MRTYTPKPGEVARTWHVIDATDVVLGRLASQTAILLRGKHKPTFAPHLDTGDHVVVINAEKIALTGAKLDQKMYYRHSGYPGGFRATKVRDELARRPIRVIERAVKGMLPHTALGKVQYGKLRVYPGPDHPHAGQVNPGPGKVKTKRAPQETASIPTETQTDDATLSANASALMNTMPATTASATTASAPASSAPAASTSDLGAQSAAAQQDAAREVAEHPEASGEPTEAGSTPTDMDDTEQDTTGRGRATTSQGNEEAKA